MQSDTELLKEIKEYMDKKPYATAYNIVQYFQSKGIHPEKILYILKEIVG